MASGQQFIDDLRTFVSPYRLIEGDWLRGEVDNARVCLLTGLALSKNLLTIEEAIDLRSEESLGFAVKAALHEHYGVSGYVLDQIVNDWDRSTPRSVIADGLMAKQDE